MTRKPCMVLAYTCVPHVVNETSPMCEIRREEFAVSHWGSSDPAVTAFSGAKSGNYHQRQVTPAIQTTPPDIFCKAAVKQLSHVKSMCRRGWNSLPKHSFQHIHLSLNAGVYRLEEENRIKGKCLPAMDLGGFLHSPHNTSQVLLTMKTKAYFPECLPFAVFQIILLCHNKP